MAAEPVERELAPLGVQSLLQTGGGLTLILMLILGGAWLFKRYGQLPIMGKGLVRILGGVSVGPRERVVVLEVENTRLVVGVAPGQIRTLHVLDARIARCRFRDPAGRCETGGSGGVKCMSSILFLLMLLFMTGSQAAPGVDAFSVTTDAAGGQTYTLTIQVLFFMTALTLLPAALMMMTSFARIIIVLAILRQALGTQSTPNNQILIGLALFLTLFIMMPVLNEVNEVAVQPYLAEQLDTVQALQAAAVPVREFMLAQTREDDLALFARIGNYARYERAGEMRHSPYCCRRSPPAS